VIGWSFWVTLLITTGLLLISVNATEVITNPSLKAAAAFLITGAFSWAWGKLNAHHFSPLTALKLLKIYLRFQSKLRISFAYLVRVKVDDHYVLIRNHKQTDKNLSQKYQPVGGVFRMFGQERLCREYGMIDDVMADSPSDDFRKRLKNPFSIFKILKWFDTKEHVESAPFREFYEELIEPGILPVDLFASVCFEKVRVEKLPAVWSKFLRIYEYKIFEIYEAKLSDDQVNALRQLMTKPNSECVFLRYDYIKNQSGKDHDLSIGPLITEHSHYIL